MDRPEDLMAMPARPLDAPRLMTAEELEALGPDFIGELVDGVLVPMSPTAGSHGSIGMRLAILLGPFVLEHGLGELFDSSTGFLLRRNPDLVRSPDVAFVQASRLAGGVPLRGYLPLAPDLAVEIISPSNTAAEMTRKLADYFGHGTRAVWLVDPNEREVTVYPAGAIPRLLGEGDTLDGGDVLPGFSTPVAALFAGLAPRA
jgi:Uma2 family endonuclease